MQDAHDDINLTRTWLRLHAAGLTARDLAARDDRDDSAGPCDDLERRLCESPRYRERLKAVQADPRIDAALSWRDTLGHHLLHWQHPAYPRLLREIPDAPLVLFVIGDTTYLDQAQIAIVGSRNPTPAGIENAHAFASALAAAGLVITSGLALGIDGAAHRGALDADAATIAVAGTGLDRVYPPRHRALAHEIAARGALVSEFFLGAAPKREHFPRRNRLISGMALGVLVVEAAIQSGSLITARLANDQGREVFAIPGSIHSPLARGCHALIRDGAKLVESAADIIEELAPQFVTAATAITATESIELVSAAEQKLLNEMGYDEIDIDKLVERSGLTTGVVSSMLLQMELRGLIATCPGGKYLRTFVRSIDERKRT